MGVCLVGLGELGAACDVVVPSRGRVGVRGRVRVGVGGGVGVRVRVRSGRAAGLPVRCGHLRCREGVEGHHARHRCD